METYNEFVWLPDEYAHGYYLYPTVDGIDNSPYVHIDVNKDGRIYVHHSGGFNRFRNLDRAKTFAMQKLVEEKFDGDN
jgi:hypothetical protein